MNTPVLSLPLHENAHTTLAGTGTIPSVYQFASGSATTGTTVTVTLPHTTVAGDCLVAYIGANQDTTNPAVTGITLGGSPGNWGSAITLDPVSESDCEIWVDWNCAGGQTSIVVTFSAGSGTNQVMIVYVEEWSLIQSASTPVDKTSSGAGISTAFNSGTTPTLSQANEVFFGAVCAETSPVGPASPWVNQPVLHTGVLYLLPSHLIVSATTGQAFAGTLPAAIWTAVIASLKSQVSSGGPAPGSGTIRISPGQPAAPGSGVGASRNSGLQWNVTGIAVSVATNVAEATAAAYISYGIQSNTPDDFQGQTQTGSTGDTCTVNATIRPGDWITVIWTGGDPGAIATARIFGTISPPGVSLCLSGMP